MASLGLVKVALTEVLVPRLTTNLLGIQCNCTSGNFLAINSLFVNVDEVEVEWIDAGQPSAWNRLKAVCSIYRGRRVNVKRIDADPCRFDMTCRRKKTGKPDFMIGSVPDNLLWLSS